MNENIIDGQNTYLKDKNLKYIKNGHIIKCKHEEESDLHSILAIVQLNGGPPHGYYWEVVFDKFLPKGKVGYRTNMRLDDFMFQNAGRLIKKGNGLSGIEIVGNVIENKEMFVTDQ